MRSTSISALLGGQLLRCYDCGLLCRTFALRHEDHSCPRCSAHALVIVGTGRPYGDALGSARSKTC